MNTPLQTERLDLAPFTLDDADAWHAIWGDPTVITWGAFPTPDVSHRALAKLIGDERSWPEGVGWLAIRRRGDETMVGDILLQPAPYSSGYEIGWHLHRDHHGRGYASEAARAVAQRCFDAGVTDRLYALIEPEHTKSIRIAEAIGMTAETEMTIDGESLVLYACERD